MKSSRDNIVPLFGKRKAEEFLEELFDRYQRGEVTEFVCCVRYTEDNGKNYNTMTSWWGTEKFSLYLLGMAARMAGIIERYIDKS